LSHELEHSGTLKHNVASLTLEVVVKISVTSRQAALWLCPRPILSVRNRVWAH